MEPKKMIKPIAPPILFNAPIFPSTDVSSAKEEMPRLKNSEDLLEAYTNQPQRAISFSLYSPLLLICAFAFPMTRRPDDPTTRFLI
jgi:hypothetical protein